MQALCAADLRPALVVSQPARPGGRGRKLLEPPVAVWGRHQGLEVSQPADVRDQDFLDRIEILSPWVSVVVAFGQIFPKALLDLPEKGSINLHASLLPRFRGAAPIQAAIMAGEQRTGVTTMLMDEGLDTGPILLQSEAEIGAEETAGELSRRLAQRGAELLVETLDRWRRGEVEPRDQDPERATIAARIRRSDGEIDWNLRAGSIFNRLRGLSPWPGSFTHLKGERVKVLWGRPIDVESAGRPGTFLGVRHDRMEVVCGEGTVFGVESAQRPGRQPVSAAEFVNGMRLGGGEVFS